jgi:hypothetical protein
MEKVIEGIRSQTVETDLYIVHQENNRYYPGAENISFELNRGCETRWSILNFVENEFTVFVDDDLQLTDPEIFETMLEHVPLRHNVSAVGVLLGDHPEKPYTSGDKVYAPEELTMVNICMGNLKMIRTAVGRKIWAENIDFIRGMRRPGTIILGDDDIISSHLFGKYGYNCYTIGNGEKPYKMLSTLHGLENDPSHYDHRNELCATLSWTPLVEWSGGVE